MATAIPFPEANRVLRAPTPEDAAAGTVYDLHVAGWKDLDGKAWVTSKWQFSADELAQLQANGGVCWFHCWGENHPPISIEAIAPLETAAGGA